MNPASSSKFIILAILDGWGISSNTQGNAISSAKLPNLNSYFATYPHTQLLASGQAVGLPRGEVGNTETGHLNLGAGRIVYQDLERINMSIADGSIYNNLALIGAIEHAAKNNSKIHLMGLLGAGGVHSDRQHLFALLHLLKMKNLTEKVYLHMFTDGRDSPPTSAKIYFQELSDVIKKEGVGQVASIMGRYWAMDRDHRWERTAKAYFALTKGQGNFFTDFESAIDKSYSDGKTDEFIEPSLIVDSKNKPIGLIEENDSVIFFNFRIDRPRQLTKAFLLKDFTGSQKEDFDPYLVKYEKKHVHSQPVHDYAFERGKLLSNLYFVTMTEYEKSIVESGAHVAYPPEVVELPLGRVISEAGLRQLRVSESEKERFVTFYFNGLRENPFVGEERLIVPSPKVATYDLKPEMSALEMTDALLSKLRSDLGFSFVLINYANADMVGHTGNLNSAIEACETLDKCIYKLASFVLATDGILILTADHGNAEEMLNHTTGERDTEHSGNPVPFLVISKSLAGRQNQIQSGVLADVAPTILKLLNLSVPSSMMGRNLLEGIF